MHTSYNQFPFILFRQLLILCLLLCTLPHSNAQQIQQGPVFGALTDQSAKVYFRPTTHESAWVEVIEEGMAKPVMRLEAGRLSGVDSSYITLIDGLKANTKYRCNLIIDGKPDTVWGSYTTFPEPGKKGVYEFVTGSCQETANMKVFDRIAEMEPRFLLHTGDYTYPDYQIRPDYSADYPTVAYSYHKRYDEKRMKEMLRTVPIDYIYDDNDYVGGSGGRYCKNDIKSDFTGFRKVEHSFINDTFPPFWRRNVIKGYDEFFPHYPLPDTSEGIFHSFVFGNAEFFFLDRCSAKDYPTSYGFQFDQQKGRWRFDPPEELSLFGEKQMAWLKKGLSESKADWKFIVSGVPLNKSIRKVIDGGMKIQKLQAKGYNGFHMSTGFSNYWAGHPGEQVPFLEFLKAKDIRNVIVLSGDTHHNVMDDGRNAGLPEMNASGLSVSGTELAYYLKLVGNVFGMYKYRRKVWNQGGNGLGNKNFKNAFGKIRIVGDEYVQLSIIDEEGEVVASFKVIHSSRKGYLDLYKD